MMWHGGCVQGSLMKRWLLFVSLLLTAAGCAGVGETSAGSAPNGQSAAPTSSGTGAGAAGTGAGTGGNSATVVPTTLPPEMEVESSYEVPVATGNYIWVANPDSGRV